jgi:hypothetical protein
MRSVEIDVPVARQAADQVVGDEGEHARASGFRDERAPLLSGSVGSGKVRESLWRLLEADCRLAVRRTRARPIGARVPPPVEPCGLLASFREYPQRQKAATFNLDEILETMKESPGSR